ncbi:MAG: S9 family peptidase [Pseudomonadota bacterium]|nr:S9 family peptidase [Pseudomonadota bacterium]
MTLPKPPAAPKRPETIVQHGRERIDDYAWLKDADWQAVMNDPERLDPDIRAYLKAENAYAADFMADTDALQTRLFEEMKGRIKQDASSVLAPDGDWDYYRRYETGGQHPVYCRRKSSDQAEEILLHGDREAEGQSYFRISGCGHSPDHGLLAYALDLNGSERYAILFRDLATGETLPDRIADARGDLVWANDGATLFYTVLDDNHRPWRVMRHTVGGEPEKDAIIYEEPDAGFFVSIDKTESRRFVTITAHDHTTSEVHLIDADATDSAPRCVHPRERNLEYEVSHHSDALYILTNANSAEDFKIVTAPLTATGRANWRDWHAHAKGRLIRSMLVFNNHFVQLERIDGLPRILISNLETGEEHAIGFDEEAYELDIQPGYEFDTALLRFTYSSMTTPQRVFDYHMTTRDRELRKEQEVPSGHDAAAYVTRRLLAESHDGALVPVSVLHRNDIKLDGSAPLLLYGYGSYGAAMPASFVTNRLSLVDRGFVYAIAHIRGGTEKGYGWYLDGKLDRKRNTFLDFIVAGEHLAQEGYGSIGRIAAHGGSAGGMLVGAVANMRPDLFGAIVGEVPFVDVLNTMSDADLPLTPPEWPEWGNPIEDKAAYDYIAAYSPYDNVAARDYPAILATAGLTDPRVTYWEPAKWVAKLRDRGTGGAPILLRTNMDAGHGGAAGRFDRLEEVALSYAFVLKIFGMGKD